VIVTGGRLTHSHKTSEVLPRYWGIGARILQLLLFKGGESMNELFFHRKRNEKYILQSVQWKSFTDASRADEREVLQLLGSGDYVQVMAFIPADMVKGGD